MHRIVLIYLAVLIAPAVFAQPYDPDDPASPGQRVGQVDTITVVAHRQPRQISEVAGTVTVFDRERLARDLVMDPADLMRYEPGVELDGGDTRFGFNGFRIRGIGGNRTAVVIDGVAVADQFAIGSFADTGRGSRAASCDCDAD